MGQDFDPTTPADDSLISVFPANERSERQKVEDWANAEHYEGAAGNDRHKIGVYADDAARDAVITSPASGNFAFQGGVAAAANAPRSLALAFYDGSEWRKGLFNPAGMIGTFAFDVTTPPEGWLACNGAAVSRSTYADLFAVIGTAFDQQDGRAAPAGTDFRVPLLAGHTIVGLTAGQKGQLGWVRNVSDLRDVFVTGTYAGATRAVFIVEITAAGTPDTFRWSSDGGATYTSGVSVASTNALGATGLTLNWQNTTGHAVGDIWTLVADPSLATVGATVGVSAWKLIQAEIPSFDTATDGLHEHTDQRLEQNSQASGNEPRAADGNSGGTFDVDSNGSAHFHNIPGGDQAHETQPHAIVLAQAIKT